MAYVISLLQGKALQWAESVWCHGVPVTESFESFTGHLQEVFELPVGDSSSQEKLHRLRQGRSSISEYILQFHPGLLKVAETSQL